MHSIIRRALFFLCNHQCLFTVIFKLSFHPKCHRESKCHRERRRNDNSSLENQKSVIAVQICFVENQKSAIAIDIVQ